MTRATVSPTFHTQTAERLQNSRTPSSQDSGFSIDLRSFKWLTYLTIGMLAAHEKKRRTHDPDRTRERLLQAAFREIHRSGFQGASIDAILAATNVTRGALYYHFENKETLGYAVVEEKVAKLTRDRWLRPMQSE